MDKFSDKIRLEDNLRYGSVVNAMAHGNRELAIASIHCIVNESLRDAAVTKVFGYKYDYRQKNG